MISRQVKCDKCGLMIISQNKFIHDAQCNPVINNQNNFSFSINQNNLLLKFLILNYGK